MRPHALRDPRARAPCALAWQVGGTELKYQPPPESCAPDKKWRLYTFKGNQMEGDPIYLHRCALGATAAGWVGVGVGVWGSCGGGFDVLCGAVRRTSNGYDVRSHAPLIACAPPPPPTPLRRSPYILFGRDKSVADLLCAHPSISKQHAVLQFRKIAKPDEFGLEQVGRAQLEGLWCALLTGAPFPLPTQLSHSVISTAAEPLRCLCLPLACARSFDPPPTATCSSMRPPCMQWSIRPYLMDLETVNGTFLNAERVEPLRYYELLAQVGRACA